MAHGTLGGCASPLAAWSFTALIALTGLCGGCGGRPSCKDVVANICKKAAACSTRGHAYVMFSTGPTSPVWAYDSEEICRSRLGDRCPDAPPNEYTTVIDPQNCDLSGASCNEVEHALIIPAGCWHVK